MQKRIRLIIDIGMTLLLPIQMAYSLIGELFHEIIGTLIFLLFICCIIKIPKVADKNGESCISILEKIAG